MGGAASMPLWCPSTSATRGAQSRVIPSTSQSILHLPKSRYLWKYKHQLISLVDAFAAIARRNIAVKTRDNRNQGDRRWENSKAKSPLLLERPPAWHWHPPSSLCRRVRTCS